MAIKESDIDKLMESIPEPKKVHKVMNLFKVKKKVKVIPKIPKLPKLPKIPKIIKVPKNILDDSMIPEAPGISKEKSKKVLVEKKGKKEKQIDKLDKQIETKKIELEFLRKEMKEDKMGIKKRSEFLGKKEIQLDNLEEQLVIKEKKLKILEKDLNKRESKVSPKEKKLSTLEYKLDLKQKQIEVDLTKIEETEKIIEKQSKESEKKLVQINKTKELKENIAELNKEKEKLEKNISQLRGNFDFLNKKSHDISGKSKESILGIGQKTKQIPFENMMSTTHHLDIYRLIDECRDFIKARQIREAEQTYQQIISSMRKSKLSDHEKILIKNITAELYDDINLAKL